MRAAPVALVVVILGVAEVALERVMVHERVAHVLLGGGATAGVALLAAAFVVLRVATIVLGPPVLLASATLALAERVRRQRGPEPTGAGAEPVAVADPGGVGAPGSVSSPSSSTSPAGVAASAVTGTSMGGRGTV